MFQHSIDSGEAQQCSACRVTCRSSVPAGVHVVDHLGGGWMMQRSLIDIILRTREAESHLNGTIPDIKPPAGFFLMADDGLLNIGQLSRAARTFGCDVIWRAPVVHCQDIMNHDSKSHFVDRYKAQARKFHEISGETFRKQLASNLGTSSTFCMASQNDVLYVPMTLATDWVEVAQQMTDVGLTFNYVFYTAIFGIAPLNDMMVMQTAYLSHGERADNILQGLWQLVTPG